MSLHPYIHFPGTCAKALAFYADVFGAPPAKTMRYDELPGGPTGGATGPGASGIMHGQLDIAGGTLMASDFPPGAPPAAQAAVTITAAFVDLAEAARVFAGLSAGAEIVMPFGPSFFSEGFGMLHDRFGTHWIVMKQSEGLR